VQSGCSQWSNPLAANQISKELLDAAYTALQQSGMQPTTQTFSDGYLYLYTFENRQILIRRCASLGLQGAQNMQAIITQPMQGSNAVFRSLGAAPNIPVIAGAQAVDPANVSTGCQGGFSTPSSWPPEMTQQAVMINNSGQPSGVYYVLFQGDLYAFTKGGGNTTLQICANPNVAVLTGGGPTTGPTVGGSLGTSPWLVVGVGVAALALGIGAAYLVTKKPKSHQEIASEEARRLGAGQFFLEDPAQYENPHALIFENPRGRRRRRRRH
jgi:hypothetical protein